MTYTFKICSITLLSFLGLASCKPQKDKAAAFPEEIIPVQVLPVKAFSKSSVITATGLIGTVNESRYAFKIGGIVDKIYVKEGDFFRRGQLLATLKLTEIDAQQQQASLSFEKAKRDYTRTDNLYRDSVSTLEQLQKTSCINSKD